MQHNFYAWEKFFLAIGGMARSPESIQERIANAFMAEIYHVGDEDLTGDLSDLAAQLRGYRQGWQPGGIAQWARGLSTEEAVNIANWIWHAYDRLSVQRSAR